MENIKACLFDLDGVIVDTAKYHYLAWKVLADELGIEFTHKHNEKLKGVSRMRSLDILLEIGEKKISEEEKLKLAERKNKIYLDYIYKMTPEEILPGVKDFIATIRNKGIKVALGSASKNAITILKQLKIESFFDAIIDGNMVSKSKPDPEVFIKGAEALNVANDQCVVFEDAEAGIEAALSANMRCIGIGSPEILGKANKVISGFENFKL